MTKKWGKGDKKGRKFIRTFGGKNDQKVEIYSTPVPANNEKLILTFVGKNVEKKGRKVEISKSMKR